MENKVIYQIYPKSFLDTNEDGVGDIRGIINKLEYFERLGVDYLWLTPVMCSPQNDNGYDISDYYNIDPMFGSTKDYIELIEKAKNKGIDIMLDLVLNHISTEHEWFKKAISGDERYLDYFIWTDTPNELNCAFGGSAWEWSPSVGKYYLHLFDITQADLNWHNPEVRSEIYKMVNYWIDLGVKGFRLDVIDLIAKEPEKMITSRGPRFQEYLEELVDHTFKQNCLTVGECWNFGPEDTKHITGSKGLTQAFHFSHINWIYPKWEAEKITIKNLAEVVEKWQNCNDVIEALVLNNHDLPRLHSYWFGKSLKDNYYKATLVASLNAIRRGNLYIYQGEEIGMTNNFNLDLNTMNDVEAINKANELLMLGKSKEEVTEMMRRISRDNARTPFQWDDSTYSGFSNHAPWLAVNGNYQQINLASDLEAEQSVYRFYLKLIEFRKANYTLFKGKYKSYEREGALYIENDNFVSIHNFSDIDLEHNYNVDCISLTNYQQASCKLRGYEAIIVKK